MMSEMIFTVFDLMAFLSAIITLMVFDLIVQGFWISRTKKQEYFQILEQYRAKYGVDEGCELLLFTEVNENKRR